MLMRFDPFRDIDRVTEQFDQLWRRVGSTVPMNAVRHEGEVVVTFDLPGVQPDDIDLTVERDVLTITAKRRFDVSEGDEVLADERPQGEFTRRILLGESLDTSRLDATYENGVLTVRLPVAEQAKPRKIAIGGSGRPAAIEAEARQEPVPANA